MDLFLLMRPSDILASGSLRRLWKLTSEFPMGFFVDVRKKCSVNTVSRTGCLKRDHHFFSKSHFFKDFGHKNPLQAKIAHSFPFSCCIPEHQAPPYLAVPDQQSLLLGAAGLHCSVSHQRDFVTAVLTLHPGGRHGAVSCYCHPRGPSMVISCHHTTCSHGDNVSFVKRVHRRVANRGDGRGVRSQTFDEAFAQLAKDQLGCRFKLIIKIPTFFSLVTNLTNYNADFITGNKVTRRQSG